MNTTILITFAVILFLGIFAQWLAWRVRMPSILLLLAFGFIAGPVTGWVNPDQLLGDLLFPIVSLSVGIILFEGGLGLRLKSLPAVGLVVRNVISIGALITWVVSTIAAYFILGLDFYLSLLLGAILIVTGPTVILPILRDLRPKGQGAVILRWEGILIDPVGATVAVLVFDLIVAIVAQHSADNLLILLIEIAIIGTALGWAFARFTSIMLRLYLIPDHLQNAAILMMVVLAYALANRIAPESGLLATTMMGMTLANQQGIDLKRIKEFKEDIGVLLVSSLFILLASRLQFADFSALGGEVLLFLAVLILIARPLTVLISTARSKMEHRDRLLLAALAPRGIVAAAVSSTFGLELARLGYPGAEKLAPITFVVIIGTVVIYGLSIGPLTRRLGLSETNPQGLLLVGAHSCAQKIAQCIAELGFRVALVDTNPQNVLAARQLGLTAHLGSILHEDVVEEMNLAGIGRLLALTANNEVNSLAVLYLAEVFGRSHVYQLAPSETNVSDQATLPQFMMGRLLFPAGVYHATLEERFQRGWQMQLADIPTGKEASAFIADHAERMIPLFWLSQQNELVVITRNSDMTPGPGQKLVALVAPGVTFSPKAGAADPARPGV